MRTLIIISFLLLASCASYVPTTETKGKKVIRKLENENKSNTERIKAIATTYNLAVIKPTIAKGNFPLPEIHISSPMVKKIYANPGVDELLDRYENKVNELQQISDDREADKKRMRSQLEEIKQELKQVTFAQQSFEYSDEYLKAFFVLNPMSDQAFTFEYTILSREVPVEIPADTMVIDAGKEYYQFWQFWTLLVLWLGSLGFIIYSIVRARN